MPHHIEQSNQATREALGAAGWERFEGEPGAGRMVATSHEGITYRSPLDPELEARIDAIQARWARQLSEEASLTQYQRRQRREAKARADARYESHRLALREAGKAVRKEAARAARQDRRSNVLMFTLRQPAAHARAALRQA